MIDGKKLKIIAISFCAVTVFLIILVIILPIIIKSKIKSNNIEKTTPSSDNTDLWAKFPGDLKTTLKHTFSVLDYTDDNNPNIKDEFTLEESIIYDNFDFSGPDDTVTFDAKSNFSLLKPANYNTINTLSLGMYEVLETLSNPPDYQIGISSLEYLLNKAFSSSDLFIRKLFTYDVYTNLIVDEERVRATLLKDVDPEKADLILSSDERYAEYSFKTMPGFYKWVKILGLHEEIIKATWLTSLFNLTSSEIDSIIGQDNYLHTYYVNYNMKLAYQFDCRDKKACGNELLCLQLISGDVLKAFGFNDTVLDLYQIVVPGYYNFSKPPELFKYFEDYKILVGKPDIKYDDYAPDLNQLYNLLDPDSPTCLLAANNSASFLVSNKTGNNNKNIELFQMDSKVINFMSCYIYDFLPKIFLYPEFTEEGETYHVDPQAKAMATITQGAVGQTYTALIKTKGIFNFILSEIVWRLLLETINNEYKNYYYLEKLEPDEVCPLIMQKALDDGKKVLKVCSDPKSTISSAESLSRYLLAYHCVVYNNTDCDMSVIEYLKTIIYITNDEIKAIYKDYIGQLYEDNEKLLLDAYGCGEKCDDFNLSKIQFWNATLSKKIPKPFETANTISDLFPEKFPYPVEMSYFLEELGETYNITEEDIDYLISLSPEGENILSEDSRGAFEARSELEQDYTLILQGKKTKNETKYKVIDILNNGFLFKNETKENYANVYNILQGNYDEDKKYVDYLANGEFFDNYKPYLNKSTGFDFGLNFSSGESYNVTYGRYTIYAKKTEDNHKMRKIVDMNDFQVLNIRKFDYNYLLKDISIVDSPILNYQTLKGDKSFSDGFQYESEDEPIYFFDPLSSRPYKFDYTEDTTMNDIDCQKYVIKDSLADGMNEASDSGSKKALITQKLNRPFMISVGNDDLSPNIKTVSKDNYICVNPFTNMVISSRINLVYSIFTKSYGNIIPKIENNKTLPIFIYQRSYDVDTDSFNKYFSNISSYYTFKTVFLIIGIIIIVICFGASVFTFFKLHKRLVNDDAASQNNIPERERLINDSKNSSMNKSREEKKEDE